MQATLIFSEAASARVGQMPMALLGANAACYEQGSSWTPQWASILGYWKLNGAIGAVANGTTVAAEVGSSGTAANANGSGLQIISGRLSQAMLFDGTDDAVNLSSTAASLNINKASFSAWARLDVSDSVLRRILHVYLDANNGVSIHLLGSDSTLRLTTTSSGTQRAAFVSSTAHAAGKWFHLAATWDFAADSSVLYLNGNVVATRNALGGSIVGSPAAMRLGSNHNSSANFWLGAIDDATLWNGVILTREEIKTIYDQQSCGLN